MGILYPSSAQSILDEGIFKMYNYELKEAVTLLDSAYSMDKEHPVTPFVRIAANWMLVQTTVGYDASYDEIYRQVSRTVPVYESLLDGKPNDPQFLLFLGSTYGIKARVALATKDWLQVIYSGYQGYRYTKKAYKKSPNLTDALMPIGLMNFFACQASYPVQLSANLFGISPDCSEGIEMLTNAVEGEGYSATEAANALTYIYLYFYNNPKLALEFIKPISEKHPQNPFFLALYGESLAKLKKYKKVNLIIERLNNLADEAPFLQQNETRLKIRYIQSIIAFDNTDWESVLYHTNWIIENYHMEMDWLLGKAHLIRGQANDILGKRELAKKDYKITASLDNYFPDVDLANAYLKSAYALK